MIRWAVLCVLAGPVLADAPQVTDVAVQVVADGWRFDVSILHGDTGWDHYADGWQVEDAAGHVLGQRVLAHPHENEQPFTRSLVVAIPDGVTQVFVRSRCNVDGWSDELTTVVLAR